MSSEGDGHLTAPTAPWICELCAHFMVLPVERNSSGSTCERSDAGHRLIPYTGTEQAIAIREKLVGRPAVATLGGSAAISHRRG